MRGRILAAALALAAAGAAGAQAAGSDTLGRTTLDARVVGAADGPFSTLTLGPGDPIDVRTDLAAAQPGREQRRRSLFYFAQLTDFQLADEESPARVEWIDSVSPLFSGAWRPQEALMPYMVNASIEQVDAHARSPFAGEDGRHAHMAAALLTGDNADDNARNEARWVAQLLDGRTVDPNSGRVDDESMRGLGCAGADRAALAAEAPHYTGVQDTGDAGTPNVFYDPDRPAGRFAAWPTYPGLLDRAQRPLKTHGLDVPSYVALGNHDGLVQGNLAAEAVTNAIATGCRKIMRGLPVAPAAARSALADLQPAGVTSGIVPPDPDRAEVTKAQYRALFAGGAQSDAHGFAYVDPAELAASRGAASYYSFSPVPGIRLVALDTIATGGIPGPGAEGNVDDPQFRWLQRTLDAAEAADELVIVYSHHAPVSLTANIPDELAGRCADPDAPKNPGCDADPRDSRPLHLRADLEQLMLAHPHVIAWVAGHSHVNDVAFLRRSAGAAGGLWVIRTSAEADFPHQDRLVDLMDNRDGTLSLDSVLLDDAAPSTAPPSGTPAADLGPDELASIGRTLGYNDPQRDLSRIGADEDRNVELLLPDPRRGTGR